MRALFSSSVGVSFSTRLLSGFSPSRLHPQRANVRDREAALGEWIGTYETRHPRLLLSCRIDEGRVEECEPSLTNDRFG